MATATADKKQGFNPRFRWLFCSDVPGKAVAGAPVSDGAPDAGRLLSCCGTQGPAGKGTLRGCCTSQFAKPIHLSRSLPTAALFLVSILLTRVKCRLDLFVSFQSGKKTYRPPGDLAPSLYSRLTARQCLPRAVGHAGTHLDTLL